MDKKTKKEAIRVCNDILKLYEQLKKLNKKSNWEGRTLHGKRNFND